MIIRNKTWRLLLVFLVAAGMSSYTNAQVTAITNVNVIDGVSQNIQYERIIIIKDGKIDRITDNRTAIPAGAEIIDAENHFALPGLIDAHAHVDNIPNARRALSYGTTTIRSASVGSYADVVLQKLVQEDRMILPEIIPAGLFVQPDLGGTILADPELTQLIGGVETEAALRKLVQINVKNGAQYIKTRSAERAGLPETDPRKQVYTEKQLGYIVDEAAKHGIKVMAHAHGAVRAAVQAGVHSIEHGTYTDEETLKLMKAKGTYLVPTYSTVVDLTEPGGDYDDPVTNIRGRFMLPQIAATVKLAIKNGVSIAAGTDTSYGPESLTRVATEIVNFVELGMTPAQALNTANLDAARLLGIDDRTGSLEEGKEADIIVVYNNPLEDIHAVHDPIIVISDGHVFLNRLPFVKDKY